MRSAWELWPSPLYFSPCEWQCLLCLLTLLHSYAFTQCRVLMISFLGYWNTLRTVFPDILPPGTLVYIAGSIIIYFRNFRSQRVTTLLKTQLLLLFATSKIKGHNCLYFILYHFIASFLAVCQPVSDRLFPVIGLLFSAALVR